MKVLIPVDGSEAALIAVNHVCTRKSRGEDIEAIVLHVAPGLNHHAGRFISREARMSFYLKECKAAAVRATERLAAANVSFQLMMTSGATAERIAKVAEQQRVDEVIIGMSRQPEWLRFIVGSVPSGVMARTDIPVTVLEQGHVGRLERYGVPAGALGLATWWMLVD